MAKSKESQITRIEKQIAALQQKQKALLDRSNAKILNQIVLLASKNGITPGEIVTALKSKKPAASGAVKKAKKVAVAPKYRNPANESETWSGRGRTPLWVKALMDAGQLDSAVIK